jgi:hypothetical protein
VGSGQKDFPYHIYHFSFREFNLEVQHGDPKAFELFPGFARPLTTERVGLAKLGNGANALVAGVTRVALQVESTISHLLPVAIENDEECCRQ